jgi:hypothetical protein
MSFKHTKKAGLHCCCSAFRGSGIAFAPNKQHRAHADMYEYTLPYEVACTWIYISRGHQYAALPWCFKRIYQIPKCQVKAYMTPYI